MNSGQWRVMWVVRDRYSPTPGGKTYGWRIGKRSVHIVVRVAAGFVAVAETEPESAVAVEVMTVNLKVVRRGEHSQTSAVKAPKS